MHSSKRRSNDLAGRVASSCKPSSGGSIPSRFSRTWPLCISNDFAKQYSHIIMHFIPFYTAKLTLEGELRTCDISLTRWETEFTRWSCISLIAHRGKNCQKKETHCLAKSSKIEFYTFKKVLGKMANILKWIYIS